jgi:hypothetical protein
MSTQAEKILRLVSEPEPATKPDPSSALTSAPALPAGLGLARVVAREGDGFRVRSGKVEVVVPCDPCVDPALVEEAIASGGRVVLEEGVIVGTLATSRSLRIDRQGAVDAEVSRFAVRAQESALLKSQKAFLELKGSNIELYGHQVLTRARELARILGRMIKLN